MAARLLLHIGTHKTGTSALQRYFSENRDALLEDGLVYPRLPKGIKTLKMAHHHVASALSGNHDCTLSEELLVRWLEDLRNSLQLGETLVLSSERFWRCVDSGSDAPDDRLAANKRFVENCSKHLQSFDTRILVNIRPQDDFLLSFYRGRCTRPKMLPMGFRRFVEKHVHLANYHALLCNWGSTFGYERVSVQKYDSSLHAAAGLQSILDGFGLKHRIRLQASSHNRHISPSSHAAEVFRAIAIVKAAPAVFGAVKAHAIKALGDTETMKRVETYFSTRSFAVPFLVSPQESNEAVRQQFFPQHEGPLFGRDIREELSELYVVDSRGLAAFVEKIFRDAGLGQEFDNSTQRPALANEIADLS